MNDEWFKIPFSHLTGKVISCIKEDEEDDYELHIECSDGTHFKMFHDQDCCESVKLIDGLEDLKALIGGRIEFAEVIVNGQDKNNDHETWTFYKLSTIQASATLRWYGTSNGYYSEGVDFCKLMDRRLARRIDAIRHCYYAVAIQYNMRIGQEEINNWQKEGI